MEQIFQEIREYEDEDLEGVVEVWRRSLPFDAITREAFISRVLLDENFDPNGLIVTAQPDGKILGFVLCIVLKHPIEKIGLMENRGFITAMGVDPEHWGEYIGPMLLESACEFFRKRNRKEVAIAPYAPNYFVPGVDRENYAHGLAWLKAHGFEEFSEGIAMDALIGKFTLSQEVLQKEQELANGGIIIRPLRLDEVANFMTFMLLDMPGDWVEDARRLLKEMVSGTAPKDSIYIAIEGECIVGYCKFAREHFGPFGVSEIRQGRGIGSVLLAKTLLQMRIEGHHSAYVLWTGERAARGVYGRLGFTISRRFAILKKTLD